MSKRGLAFILVSQLFLAVLLIPSSVNGLTWSSDKLLLANSMFDGAPSITQTSDHRIWVTWQKDVSPTPSIFYTVSSDYGFTWAPEKNITTFPSFDLNVDPTITQLSNGTIWIVYPAKKVAPPQPGFDLSAYPSSVTISKGSSGNSNITALSFGGFNSPIDMSYAFRTVPPQNITASFNPDPVTPPPNGKVNSTMTINVGPTVAAGTYSITVKGDSLNPAYNDTVVVSVVVPSNLSAGESIGTVESSLSADSEPQSLDNYEIYYKASHDGGESWSPSWNLTENSADDLTPAILQAVNGTLWLAWTSLRTGNTEIFYKVSNDAGVTWSNDTQLTVNSTQDERPSIAQMQDGRIWVAWHSSRFGNNEIMYKTHNGTGWSVDRRLTTLVTKDDTSPSLLQTGDGVIWVFWAQYDTALYDTADIYYMQSLDNGDSWLPPARFTTHSSEDVWPGAVQSDDSRVWVVWTSNRSGNWDIYYRNSLVHNLAVTDVVPSPSQVYQMENVSVSATVHNFGDYGESFTVNCYANTSLVDSHVASLGSGSWMNLVLSWNTSSFVRGNYYVTVEVVPVLGEVYTGDNVVVHGTVYVKLLGDVNDSGLVNVFDVFSLGKAFGSVPGSSNWNEEADMNGDSAVGSADLSRLAGNFGSDG